MNGYIRLFGWLLFFTGSILTVIGVMSVIELIHVRIETFGINLDRIEERIAWIVSWLVVVVSGGLLLALTGPEERSRAI